MFTMAGFILWDKMKTTDNNDTMFTMVGFILWDKMEITYNNGHNAYNGWFDPLGQDEDNIQ